MPTTYSDFLKRSFAIGSLALGSLALSAWAPASAATVSFSPAAVSVATGESFTVDVRISDAADLFGFQFDLGFDPSKLTASVITEGAFLQAAGATLFIEGTVDNTAGTVSELANSLNGAVPGANGNGVLATIRFTAASAGTSSINLFNTYFLDSGLAELTVGAGGPISVTATGPSTAVPEPSSALLALAALAALGASRRRA